VSEPTGGLIFMYCSIEIDFDVFKELTVRRKSPEVTENDVLRELLELGSSEHHEAERIGPRHDGGRAPWVWKGVILPHGTELRATRGGRMYNARIENGAILYNGTPYKSPSTAAGAITGNSVNGWTFWEYQEPAKKGWLLLASLRKAQGLARAHRRTSSV
jgi:hypothetical protein